MKNTGAARKWSGPPLALQITALLLAGLVVAQLVTLALTMLLPPEPQRQYELSDITEALNDTGGRSRRFLRTVQSGPPEPVGPGWLSSERSRRDLAELLGRNDAEVRLFFFTPLPFAGTARAAPRDTRGAAPPPSPSVIVAGWTRVDYQVAQGGPGGPGGGGFGGPGGGGFPGGGAPRGMEPGGMFPPASGRAPSGPPGAAPGGRGPEAPAGAAPPAAPPTPSAVPRGLPDLPIRPAVPEESTEPVAPAPPPAPAPAPMPSAPTPPVSAPARPRAVPVVPAPAPVAPAAATRVPAPAPAPPVSRQPEPPPLAVTALPRGLFGLAPAPFVEGDFIAGMRMAQGGWVTVQPMPEPFPNAWQRRVLLWFLIASLLVAPVGWWFSRRLVRPIAAFARAAEQLGRDPQAPVLALRGPAEVGRAAQAFNRMQSRLLSFVQDRTAMMGAISHDLRTPLTRMRFRIEDVPDDVRVGMLDDLEEMERMIASVLAFIRDASEPSSRERLDLSSMVEDVVEDAIFTGKDVRLEHSERASVDVDAIGMRRLLNNLVENAVKYGSQARVRLFTDQLEAVVEVSDSGPGLPAEELERVFEPFYRAPGARKSGQQGSGLGLAVCRSIARAHGGEVRLTRGARGLVAQVRLPLAYDTART